VINTNAIIFIEFTLENILRPSFEEKTPNKYQKQFLKKRHSGQVWYRFVFAI